MGATSSEEILWAWVHLSDIHVGHGDAQHRANQPLVLESLRDDLQHAVKEAGLQGLNAILVTGDVGFSGDTRELEKGKAPLEYERAREWLKAVAAKVGLGREHIFLVPGNHDVQRPVDKDDDIRRFRDALRSGKESVDDALANAVSRERLASRLANYLSFSEAFAPACLANPIELRSNRLWWTHVIAGQHGLKIRLVGLNTALLSADNKDKNKLRLGEIQLNETLQDRCDGEVIIVMTHHPFGAGWLADEASADDWVRSRANIHICGHVHDPESQGLRRGGATHGFVRIVAGAVHEEKRRKGDPHRHGYNVAAIVRGADGNLRLRVWARRWADKRKGFHLDTEDSKPGTHFSEHELGVELKPPTPEKNTTDDAALSSGGSTQENLHELRVAHGKALASCEPGAIAATIVLVTAWVRAGEDHNARHSRWLDVQGMFTQLDLSIWESDRTGIRTVALALADLDFYRQTDLSTEARFELLTRVRKMLPVTERLACARVDLTRAVLAAMSDSGEDPAWALTLCDDALGPAQQLASDLGPMLFANALFDRAQILGSLKRFDEAIAEVKRAEKIYDEHGDVHSLANVNSFLGEIWSVRHHWPNAQMFLNDAIAKYRETGDSVGEAQALISRARVWPPKRAQRAILDCDEAVRLCDVARMRALQGEAMLIRAQVHERASSFIEATSDYYTAVQYLEASPDRYSYVLALLSLAAIHDRIGRADGEIRTCIERAEEAAKMIKSERIAAIAFLRICEILQEMSSPDKPGIARNASLARNLADSCGDLDLEATARMFLSYAGYGLIGKTKNEASKRFP
jgi:tetratricopeptide (TPR) repeat protein